MSAYIIFPSLLQAQRGGNALSRRGIPARIIKSPRTLEEKGCSYGVRFSEKWLNAALAALSEGGIRYGKVYVRDNDGYREAEM